LAISTATRAASAPFTGARALRLLLGARREHAVGDRDAGLELHVEDAAGALVRDDFESV
jgi:hypothetical protein